MAEVGLLPFARMALQVFRAVLPSYRTRFSEHQFTQPQLLAMLCLMRFKDWTFREAEVWLGEHRELSQALGLVSMRDFTTLYRFLQRLNENSIDRAVGTTVRRPHSTCRKERRRRCNEFRAGARSSPLLCRGCIIAGKNHCPGDIVEVGGRGGSRSAVSVVAHRATRSVERLWPICLRRASPKSGCHDRPTAQLSAS
jgi:hypothetical protein